MQFFTAIPIFCKNSNPFLLRHFHSSTQSKIFEIHLLLRRACNGQLSEMKAVNSAAFSHFNERSLALTIALYNFYVSFRYVIPTFVNTVRFEFQDDFKFFSPIVVDFLCFD